MIRVRAMRLALALASAFLLFSAPAGSEPQAAGRSEITRLRQELKQARHKREPWKWTTFTTKDGLGDDHVWTIHEARDGALWFGTRSGVSRFDGLNWRNFGVQDGLIGGDVRAIHERADGTLWFGGRGGISIYDGKRWRTIRKADGLRGEWVTAIHERNDGTFWIGTLSTGVLNIFDGKSWRYSDGDSLSVIFYDVGDIDEDEMGRVWISGLNQDRMLVYGNGQWSTQPTPGRWTRRILHRADGSHWFATSEGLVAYHQGRRSVFNEKSGLASDETSDLLEQAGRALWIATGSIDLPERGRGVSRFDGDTFETFNADDGLGANNVLDIAAKRDGTVWFATWGGGVSLSVSKIRSPSPAAIK
jgi:ligand-binding sensor domain-containing protein